MPRFDRTGPMGHGVMTGGRRGRCAGDAPGPVSFSGAGRGQRRGGGYGRRNQFYATRLTGWQRAERMDAGPAQAATPQSDRVARVESALADVLERLEKAGQR